MPVATVDAAGPVYIGLRDIGDGEVWKTIELHPGLVFADFDHDGSLVGVEVIR